MEIPWFFGFLRKSPEKSHGIRTDRSTYPGRGNSPSFVGGGTTVPPFQNPKSDGKKGCMFFHPKKTWRCSFTTFEATFFYYAELSKCSGKLVLEGLFWINKNMPNDSIRSQNHRPKTSRYLLRFGVLGITFSACVWMVYGIKSWKHLSINPDPGRNDAIWRMCIFFDGFVGKKNAAPEINSRFTFSNHRKNISEIKDTYGGGMDIH